MLVHDPFEWKTFATLIIVPNIIRTIIIIIAATVYFVSYMTDTI